MIATPNRYQWKEALTSGGMSHAAVYWDNHLDRDVLIKELRPGVDQRRIYDEVAALTGIRSKHVVQIYDVIKSGSKITGIVEEYISGPDLLTLAPLQDAAGFIRIAYAISCGLSDIHMSGRVHRDVKPNNMKFDAEGCLKIFDFGLARVGQINAATQGAVGTQGYMAPELCVDSADTAEFTRAIDTYAFGITMLALCLNPLPQALRRFPPTLPCLAADFASLNVGLPANIAASMNACLETSAVDRPEMKTIRDLLGLHMLRDQHRATLIVQGKTYVLDAKHRAVVVTLPGGVARLSYNGLQFSLAPVSGDVYINNVKAMATQLLPESCVITFGGPQLRSGRYHVSLDVSHPEVVL